MDYRVKQAIDRKLAEAKSLIESAERVAVRAGTTADVEDLHRAGAGIDFFLEDVARQSKRESAAALEASRER